MKKYFTYQNVMLNVSLIAMTTLAIIFSSPLTWLIWASSMLGILSSKFGTEGKWVSFIFDIISYSLYIYICFKEQYYGEMVLSVLIIIIHLFSLREWKNNQDKTNTVIVNCLSKKEIVFAMIIGIVGFIGYGVILYFTQCKYPFLNAIPTIMYLLANYFCFRRSTLQFVLLIFYETFFILLWILASINGEFGSLIFLVDGICELAFAIIGIYSWKNIKQNQNMQK